MPTIVRRDEANQLIDLLQDERTKAFVKHGIVTVLMRNPQTLQIDFDLCYFAEVLKAMAEKRVVLDTILRGDVSSLNWWPESE